MDDERSALAPREMCALSSGRKRLKPHWWKDEDFEEGSLLRYREECKIRRERAARRRKSGKTWDQCRQAEIRSYAHWAILCMPEELWIPSEAIH